MPHAFVHADRDAVRLHAGQQESSREHGRNRKRHRVPPLPHGLLDVVRRTAAILAVIVFLLVDLRERALDVGRGRTEQAP